MNRSEFKTAISRLGCETQAQAAEKLGIDVRTVRRYALGECPVPATTAKLIEFMLLEREAPVMRERGRPLLKVVK